MKEYHKIETLLDRDSNFKVVLGKWRIPEFEYLQNNRWEFTEKVDGTNIRVIWRDEKLSWGGKTDNAQIPSFLINKLQSLFSATSLSAIFPNSNVCFYGEGYGAKIQKMGGNYKSDGCDFILFDILIDEWWLTRKDMEDVASKLGVRVVPILRIGTLIEAIEMTKSGIISQWGNFPAEGIVVRPTTQLLTRHGHRIIGKIKSKDF